VEVKQGVWMEIDGRVVELELIGGKWHYHIECLEDAVLKLTKDKVASAQIYTVMIDTNKHL